MKLYHFTSRMHLGVIMGVGGLCRGDVPILPSSGVNAVWLTANPIPWKQRWAEASLVDKTAVKITVEIADDDPALVKWEDFARMHKVPQWWYAALDETGGFQSSHWYVYQGMIKTDDFLEVTIFDEL